MAAGLKPGFVMRKEILNSLMSELTCFKCHGVPNGIKPKIFKCTENFHPLCEICKDQRCLCGSKIGRNPCTLLTLLRIPFLGRIGSISYVLPIRQNIDILNRDIRVRAALN